MGERSVQKNRSLGKKHGRILILACIFMLFGALWQFNIIDAFAKAGEECGDFYVTGGILGVDYVYKEGVLTILTGKPLTIKNVDASVATTDHILIAEGVDANIILKGIYIDTSAENAAAFRIADNSKGKVTLELAPGTNNVLKSGWNHAGIEKNGGDDTGTLTIRGNSGTLTVEGGQFGAGIGSGKSNVASNILIDGGVITTTGGLHGAGIGGGERGIGNNIVINGGLITTKGGTDGAGIGGGYYGSGSNITISGGKVTTIGGTDGAGIGGGYNSIGSNITIEGGTVIATGGDLAAGIGGGYYGSGSSITIEDGYVVAEGGEIGGAGIGGGNGGMGSDITIKGGTVDATGRFGAGIGGGSHAVGKNIEILGGDVTAVASRGGEDIGNGNDAKDEEDVETENEDKEEKEPENDNENIDEKELKTGDNMLWWMYVSLGAIAATGILIMENSERKERKVK